MKKFIILILLSAVPLFSYADEGAKKETVEELLKVTKVEAILDSMYSQVDKMFLGMAKQLGVKESEQPIFDKFMLKVAKSMRQEMTWEKMKAPMIKVYMKHYTEKEIKDLLTFYKSDTGRKMIDKMPLVMRDSMQISQSMFHDFMPKMKKLSVELNKELQLARNNK